MSKIKELSTEFLELLPAEIVLETADTRAEFDRDFWESYPSL